MLEGGNTCKVLISIKMWKTSVPFQSPLLSPTLIKAKDFNFWGTGE